MVGDVDIFGLRLGVEKHNILKFKNYNARSSAIDKELIKGRSVV